MLELYTAIVNSSLPALVHHLVIGLLQRQSQVKLVLNIDVIVLTNFVSTLFLRLKCSYIQTVSSQLLQPMKNLTAVYIRVARWFVFKPKIPIWVNR
jgi:hypothetical protein